MGWRGILALTTVMVLFTVSGCGDSKGAPIWTVMVYMAGDNNLSLAASRDLAEMEVIGSTAKVNVVAQIDTLGGSARRVFVQKGGSTLMEDLGERNMADSATLTEFILWAKANFPAHRYTLILWNHGDGLAKSLPTRNPPMRKILQDDTDNVPCCLSNRIVRQAIEDAGLHFNLLGFDASQMGQIETAYEFRDLADILLFSQETGQENGWDYTAILSALADKPLMPDEELSTVIVDSYRAFYEGTTYPSYLTLSAIRLGEDIHDLAMRIDTLSGLLIEGLTADHQLLLAAIGTVREETQEMNPLTIPDVYVDLMDLVENLQGQLEAETDPSPLVREIIEETGAILAMKDEIILSEYHGEARPGANGISIVFFRLPEAMKSSAYDTYTIYFPDPGDENQILFIKETRWDDFLQTYYQAAGLI